MTHAIARLSTTIFLAASISLSAASSADSPNKLFKNQSDEQLADKAFLAFQEQQYNLALSLYQKISSSDFLVRYNLAVCYFKLEQWRNAKDAFEQLHYEDPNNELVQYNLALSEYKLKNFSKAKFHLDALYAYAESDELAILALELSQSLPADLDSKTITNSVTRHQEDKYWFISASLGFGADNNVVSIIDDEATKQSDSYTEINISPTWYSSSDLQNAWIINGAYFESQYYDQNKYDAKVMSFAIQKNYAINTLNTLNASFRTDESSFGGRTYLRANQLELGWRLKAPLDFNWHTSITKRQSEAASREYIPYAGNTFSVRTILQKQLAAHRLSFEIKYSDEDKNGRSGDPVLFEDTLIQSANRLTATANWRFTVQSWRFRTFYSYRNSHFKDENIVFTDELSLPDIYKRQDTRSSCGLNLSKDLNDLVFIEADYRETKNNSNEETYSYDQRLISLGLGVQF